MDRLHVRRLRLPARGARGDDPARGALRGVQGGARDPHRQARGRPRDRAAVHRRARQLRADGEPPRLLARAAPAELPVAHARRRPEGLRRREDRRHLRRAGHRRVAPDEVEHRGDPVRPRSSCARSTTGSSSRTSSRPTCSGGTATTRSTSTAACRTSTSACRICSTRCGRATCSSSPRITAATRRRRRPTTRASTGCSSPTSRGGTLRARSTRASSPTSARP